MRIATTRQRSYISSILALGVVAAPGVALSQEKSLALEEVIVTATKREASLQDVSVAVTALPDFVLNQAHAVTTEDIVALVPSLTLQKGQNPRSSSFNIRGIGTQSFSTAVEPSVSTVVDGVVMGRSGQSFMQLLDVSRVEVLRGPQGTLFGKNSSAGVVHVISKDPTEEFEGEAMGALEERGAYRGGVTVAGPLVGNLSGRLTAFGSHEDGWIKNWYDGSYRNESDDWSARGKLKWDASDTLTVRWSSDYYQKDCVCSQPTIRSMDPDPDILAEIYPVVPGEENTAVNNDGDMSLDVESYGHALQFDWEVGEFVFTSISALRNYDETFDEDVDNRPIEFAGIEQEGTLDQQQFTQEFRLTSPADGWVTYVVGAFYFKQEVRRTFERTVGVLPDPTTFADFTVDTENYAFFGEGTINLADNWRLIAGLRYTHDDLSFDFDRSTTNMPDVVNFDGGTDEDNVSGKLAVEWDVADAAMLYLSYSQGYKGPAFSLTATTEPPATDPVTGEKGSIEPVKPETVDAFELGLKSKWWDDRLTLNVAAFYAIYDNWQAEAYVPGPTEEDVGVFETSTAGKVSTRGIELDLMAQLTENLSAMGGLTVLRARMDEFTNGPCSFGQDHRGECPDGLQDLSGGDLPFSPDWKANVMLNYIIPTQSLPFDWRLAANYSAQDEIQYGVSQDPYMIQDAFGLLDLSAAIEAKSGHYSLTAYVKNALDDFYVLGIGATSGFIIPNGYLQQVPRTFRRTAGIELRLRW